MTEDIGIVISELDYGETSKIINVLTRSYGVIGMHAKGARTMKSPLRSVSTKLTYGKFYFRYHKDKLSILTNVDALNSLKNIKKDITKISYTSYLIELASQVVKQNNEYEKIFDLLINTILKIEEGFDPLVLTNILELKYLEFLGALPILDACSVCGKTTNIATISSFKGGYLCSDCLKDEKIVSEKTIKLIRMFYYVDISKIEKLDISDSVKNEINMFLDDYYDRYTGLYLNTKSFIKNLNKL